MTLMFQILICLALLAIVINHVISCVQAVNTIEKQRAALQDLEAKLNTLCERLSK